MSYRIQEGIYYGEDQAPGTSCSLAFLRASEDSKSEEIATVLTNLWSMYKDLKQGIIRGIPQNIRNRYSGNISVLMGFGPSVFEIKGIRVPKPRDLDEKWLFRLPFPNGGGPVMDDVGLAYAKDVTNNHISTDHVVIQFIGDSELSTYRAIVETWKLLRDTTSGKESLKLTSFYTGFNRPDKRSWLGFHDGVSNMTAGERLGAIAVSGGSIDPTDAWTVNGTYLALLRIQINLEIWDKIPREEQERIVGRDKLTGCPLSGVDRKNNNVPIKGCPAPGTFEIFEKGNERFREHPPYGEQFNLHGISDVKLIKSHIGRTYKVDKFPTWDKRSSRIFRQGYEFLESIDTPPFIRVGLNFVSFQASTERFWKVLKYGIGTSNFGGDPENIPSEYNNLLSVRSGGIFLVPPYSGQDAFPGEKIFRGVSESPIRASTK